MSNPVEFQGYNVVLAAPPGSENIQPLPIFRNGTCCVSCWEMSDEEMAEIARTKRVFISIFSGQTQPPVYVGSETTTRDVVSDYGVWKR